jgi:hypothetical protein
VQEHQIQHGIDPIVLRQITLIGQTISPPLGSVITQRSDEPFDPDLDGYRIWCQFGNPSGNLEPELGLAIFGVTPNEWIEDEHHITKVPPTPNGANVTRTIEFTF